MNQEMEQALRFLSSHSTFPVTVRIGDQTGWRVRVKLAVRQIGTRCEIGLFREHSHDLLPMGDCPDHHPRINEAIKLIKEWCITERISGYNELQHTGDLRYIQCVVERRSGLVQLTVVVTGSIAFWQDRIRTLFETNPSVWHSCWINVQPGRTNTIFGSQWVHCCGPKYIFESLGGHEIPFLPSYFGQANLGMFEQALSDIHSFFPKQQHIVELFAGVGVISASLCEDSASLVLYEKEPCAYEGFLEMQKNWPTLWQQKTTFFVGNAQLAYTVCQQASAVIVDPTRKGLSKELVETIAGAHNVEYLVYLSCCWETFQRDVSLLMGADFSIDFARLYEFFPHTPHIETLVLLRRVRS